MKRILILTFLLTFIFKVNAKESPYRIDLKMLSPIENNSWCFSDDSLDINITIPNGLTTYNAWEDILFCLTNKTANRVYIEWENARIMGQKPAFGTDTKLTVRNKKEDEVVVAGLNSIPRTLLIEDYRGLSGLFGETTYTSPWDPDSLKKEGIKIFDFILPIRFEDGKTTDFKFKLLISWVNISDVSEIKVGMKSKEVKQTIGSPEYKEKIEKGHEIWHYTNNAYITIIDGKVQDIKIIGR